MLWSLVGEGKVAKLSRERNDPDADACGPDLKGRASHGATARG